MDGGFTSALLGDDSSNHIHADEDANAPRPERNANGNLSHRLNPSGAPAAPQVPGQQHQIPGQPHMQQEIQQQPVRPPQQQEEQQQQEEEEAQAQAQAQQRQQPGGPARPGHQAAAGLTPRLSPGAFFQQLEENGVIRTPQQRQQINDLKIQLSQMRAQGVSINPVEFRSKLHEIIPRRDLQNFLLLLVQRSNSGAPPGQVQQQQQEEEEAQPLSTQQIMGVHQASKQLSQQRRSIMAVSAPKRTVVKPFAASAAAALFVLHWTNRTAK